MIIGNDRGVIRPKSGFVLQKVICFCTKRTQGNFDKACCKQAISAQQSVHLTLGILRTLQAVFYA